MYRYIRRCVHIIYTYWTVDTVHFVYCHNDVETRKSPPIFIIGKIITETR